MATNLNKITYRSSWERDFMVVLDLHPDVISWCSEAISIPYINPFLPPARRNTLYVPDFFVVWQSRNTIHKELIEIKPSDEVMGFQGKVSKLKESRQVLNMIKWDAARRFCAVRNWTFRVATELQLYAFKRQNKV